MGLESDNLETVRHYFAALERFATGEELAAFFTPDVRQVESPNRLVPNGATRDLAALQASGESGRRVMSAQRFKVLNEVAAEDRVALEVLWTGTLAVPMGSLPIGGEMRAHFGVFMKLRDGRIAEQHNYDCFDPWWI